MCSRGARVAVGLAPDLVLFDGSGAALPPIAADRTVVVVGGHQDPAVVGGYLNTYRLLLADVVVVTMAEEGSGWGDGSRPCGRVRSPGHAGDRNDVAATPGRRHRGALCCLLLHGSTGRARTAARAPRSGVRRHASSTCPGTSRIVAALRKELVDVRADVFLVELKAAAIDVVAEEALAHGAEVVLATSDVVPLAGEPDLDELLLGMAKFTS